MKPLHLLIVDDEEMLTHAMQLYFEMDGFRVSTAHDGSTALAINRDDPVDAVVTDFLMPGMNGHELVTALRHSHPDLPAIVVSGYTNLFVIKEDAKTKLLQKPARLASIEQCLRSMLSPSTTAN
jgi:two-component system, cell cycle sensor histidine kinase and response regulator CckA